MVQWLCMNCGAKAISSGYPFLTEKDGYNSFEARFTIRDLLQHHLLSRSDNAREMLLSSHKGDLFALTSAYGTQCYSCKVDIDLKLWLEFEVVAANLDISRVNYCLSSELLKQYFETTQILLIDPAEFKVSNSIDSCCEYHSF